MILFNAPFTKIFQTIIRTRSIMKFGTWVFPVSESSDLDGQVIDNTLEEIVLCDRLGYEAVWLSEHHFDGAVAYADPVSFASSITQVTNNIKIGFAVVEMALHHPVRLAAQTALIDNLSKGRLMVGTGKGSAFNQYEYKGFGVDMSDSEGLLEESEQILIQAWAGEPVTFKGKHWNLNFPGLRPLPFQKPHPPLFRACLGMDSTKAMARIGRPVLIASQENRSIESRLSAFTEEISKIGLSESKALQITQQIWVTKNLVIAEDGDRARDIAWQGYERDQTLVNNARNNYNSKEFWEHVNTTTNLEEKFEDSFIVGTPREVEEQIAELHDIGVQNLMLKMNTGNMPQEDVLNSISLFSQKIAPRFID